MKTEQIRETEDRSQIQEAMTDCVLCPRNCHVDRTKGRRGFCGMPGEIYGARAALHMWEEPCISGKKGSGAVFFFRMLD